MKMRFTNKHWTLIATAAVTIAALVLVTGSMLQAEESPSQATTPGKSLEAVTTEITLYFADWQAQHVIPETREIAPEGNLAEIVAQNVIDGPSDPYLMTTLPTDTILLSIEVVDQIAYINLSGEVRGTYGSTGEMMAIQSLVYSLTDLDEISQVQILIEGEIAETLAGHLILDEALQRGQIHTHPIFIDEERASWLQERADQGTETFRTDPLEAAIFAGRMAGFWATDAFELVDVDQNAGTATVLAERDGEEYVIRLIQPVRTDDGGIWMIDSVNDR